MHHNQPAGPLSLTSRRAAYEGCCFRHLQSSRSSTNTSTTSICHGVSPSSSATGFTQSSARTSPGTLSFSEQQPQQLRQIASFSRVLLLAQPSNLFRSLAQRRLPRISGPVSLLLFLFGALMAVLAAIRNALIRRVKECRTCQGFGIVRCRLCNGEGYVTWQAKFNYSDACPVCNSKRVVQCPDCGGYYHRVLFARTTQPSPQPDPDADFQPTIMADRS